MPLTLVETPGSATANTYATLAEADAFVDTLSFSGSWGTKSNEERSAALVNAARLMDTISWKGARSDATQALAWPRCAGPYDSAGLRDRDGYEVSTSTVPHVVKSAQVMFALALLDEDRAADAGGLAPAALQVGSLQLSGLRRQMIPAVVYDLCGFFMASRPGMVRVERA